MHNVKEAGRNLGVTISEGKPSVVRMFSFLGRDNKETNKRFILLMLIKMLRKVKFLLDRPKNYFFYIRV
jgi:hypothetical protein